MKKRIFYSVLIFVLFLTPGIVLANNIVINEIAWMGSTNSANDEWLELFNNGQSTVNLDGWVLKSADEKLKINLKSAIPGQGFFLLERTDDQTVPNIAADLIYKGSLSNSGETLILMDNSGAVIDQVACQEGWPAGDNKTKQTMERAYRGSSPASWQTSALANGTPKETNSQGITNSQKLITNNNEEATKPSPLPTSTSEVAEISESPEGSSLEVPLGTTNIQQVKSTNPLYPKSIFINEILPAPEGADEQNEWLEIYNDNDFAVDLAGWRIKDQVGAIKTYTWPENSPLGAKGFLIVSRAQSKIVLQNNGDGLTLINPQGTIVDQIVYPTAPANQSYNRTNNGWTWSRTLTPGNANEIDRINAAVQQKIAQKNQQTTAPAASVASSNFSGAAAQINQFSPSINKLPRVFTFLLGLAIAIASAVVVVFLRKKQRRDSCQTTASRLE